MPQYLYSVKLTLSGTCAFVPAVPIWVACLLRITAGPHEVEDALGARGGAIADADLEHPHPAVHLVVGRLVQVDRHPPRRPTSRFLDHLAAELVVPPEQDRDREAIPEVVGGGRGRLHGDRHRLGPGDVHAITHLETFDDLGVGGVQQSARVARPVRSGEGHDLVGRRPTGDGHGRHPLPGSRGTRQLTRLSPSSSAPPSGRPRARPRASTAR